MKFLCGPSFCDSYPTYLIYMNERAQQFFCIDIALGKSTQQSSLFESHTSSKAVDGNTNGALSGGSCSHTKGEMDPWWNVNFGQYYFIRGIEITNRADCCHDRLQKFAILIDDKL